MVKVFKSGKKFQGNKNSGDKPDSVKFRAMIDKGLASHIMNEELERINNQKVRKHIELKEIVMPIVLKGMTEKTDITSGGEKLQSVLVEFINGQQNNNSNTD